VSEKLKVLCTPDALRMAAHSRAFTVCGSCGLITALQADNVGVAVRVHTQYAPDPVAVVQQMVTSDTGSVYESVCTDTSSI